MLLDPSGTDVAPSLQSRVATSLSRPPPSLASALTRLHHSLTPLARLHHSITPSLPRLHHSITHLPHAACPIVLERLHNLVLGIHHERSITRHGLVEWLATNQQHAEL